MQCKLYFKLTLLFPDDVFPTLTISGECKFAKIRIGLFVRKSENTILFYYAETV